MLSQCSSISSKLHPPPHLFIQNATFVSQKYNYVSKYQLFLIGMVVSNLGGNERSTCINCWRVWWFDANFDFVFRKFNGFWGIHETKDNYHFIACFSIDYQCKIPAERSSNDMEGDRKCGTGVGGGGGRTEIYTCCNIYSNKFMDVIKYLIFPNKNVTIM